MAIVLQNLVQLKHPFTRIVISPGLTTKALQHVIATYVNFTEETRVKSQMLPGKPGSSKVKTHHVFFLDDLNTAAPSGKTGTKYNIREWS